MFIYNVTVQVEDTIAGDWLTWMHNEHLAEVMQTGMFDSYTLLQLVEPEHEGSKTYVVQYHTSDESRYRQYIEEFAPLLREKGITRFGERFIAFRTVLRKI